MEALLGASNSNPTCGSVLQLKEQLHSVFSTKVTEKRAEHVSVTLELRSTSVFHIPITEPENEQLEQAASIDPSLGGARSNVGPALGGDVNGNVNGNQPTRQINAIDALINQPSDDHVLQKSVAKHIITTLGEIDGSTWAVRQVLRGEQGWTFGYICKDSWQAWSRQNAKNPARAVIGEWSQKPENMDAVNLSRPAFDCRGSITIAFLKGRRVIEVKYDHTPLHKTVGELIKLLVPPPPPHEPKHISRPKEPKKPKEPKAPRPPQQPKAPKAPRPPKDPNAPKPPRKKRPAGEGGAEGDGTQPKKRRKKKDAAAVGPDGSVLPPGMPGALPVGQSSERSLCNSHAGGSGQNGYSTYLEGLVGQSPAAADEGVHVHSILNIPPAEAARRRTVAINLLESGGINPKTLSPEQFNIFANQSPELQQESLTMLKKYGAERLRIVHPEKDQGDAAPAAPAAPAAAAPSTPPINAPKKKSKKKKSEAADTQEAVAQSGGKKKKKDKITRGKCDPCRDRKIPCAKEKPSCSNCTSAGLQCHYALERKVKDVPAESEAKAEAPAQPVAVETDDEPDGLGSPGFHHEPVHEEPASHEPYNQEQDNQDSIGHMPHGLPNPELVSPQPEPSTTYHQPSDLYQHFNSSVDASATPDVAHTGVTPAAMDYLHNDNSLHNFSYTQPQPEPEPVPAPVPEPELIPVPAPVVEQPPPVQHTSHYAQQSSSTQSGVRTRRSLPSGPSMQSGAPNGHTTHAPTESWTPVPVPQIPAAYQGKPSPRASRARKPVPAAPQPPAQTATQHRTQNNVQQQQQQPVSQAFDDLRQTSSWSSVPQPTVPVQKTTQQQARTSPYQTAAQTVRTSSRQGNRSQNHTPVQQQTSASGRHTQLQTSQSHTNSSSYQSNTGVTAPSSVGNYEYSQYPTSSSRTEATNPRMNYEHYTNPSSTTPNSYSSYDTYNTRSSTKTPVASLSAAQPTASSYNTNTATAAPSTSQWGSTTSVPQTRSSTRSTYDTNPTTSTSNSYNMPSSNTQQSSSLQGFNVRPQSMTQTRSSTAAAYAQQQQQHHQQQSQAQQQRQQVQQQQPSYNSYTSQSHTTSTQQPQHQQQQQTQQQTQQQQQTQNWGYGGFSSTANPSSTGYGSTGASGSANTGYSTGTSASSHAQAATNVAAYGSHQQPQHRSMNLSSNTYSSHIGNEDQVLYDLLRHPGA